MSDVLLIKKEVIQTQATRGWRFITERADSVILKMQNDAIDQEDKAKSETLVTEARAAKKFWKKLLESLAASTEVDAETTDQEDTEQWNEVSN